MYRHFNVIESLNADSSILSFFDEYEYFSYWARRETIALETKLGQRSESKSDIKREGLTDEENETEL